MIEVYYMNPDKIKHVISQDGAPVGFKSDEEAWSFIRTIMNNPTHPLFMWIKEVGETNG